MENRWNESEAKKYQDNPVEMRAYSSRLLGADSDLVLHGGGNTSVKVGRKNFFGEDETILYVKGSGYDLSTIPAKGFAPVKLDVLLKLAKLETLSDTDMVREQKVAMIDPSAPGPSVEAILHALIPFKFVDHTHTDAVVTLTNNPNREKFLTEIYGDDILILPYIMPGFILAKQVYEATKDIDWSKLRGIILLNHGVFTFADDAKTAYSNMIDIVSEAEQYILKNTKEALPTSSAKIDLELIAKTRKYISTKMNKAVIAKFNSSDLAAGFASIENVADIGTRGTVTPDHSIHTKKSPMILDGDIEVCVDKYMQEYTAYFKRYASEGMTQLDSLPRWAIIPDSGTMSFGINLKRANIVHDISEHTMKCIQHGEMLGGWTPLDEKNLFDLEYWELEQAKLKKQSSSPEFSGKIAIVTGAASGIGKAIVEDLNQQGACIAALDINPEINKIFSKNEILPIQCDLTNSDEIKQAIEKTVLHFGGVDIVVSNAGSFPPSSKIEKMDSETWDKVIELNLSAHQRLLTATIPYLKEGIDSSVIFIASKNVMAPGPGAAAYSSAKAGMTQLARVAALELGQYGIRVNMVHPNQVFDTGIWSEDILNARANHYKMSVEEYKTNNILKTQVTSLDVAKLVSFMCSSCFLKTTGAQIPIDGGNERVI